MKPHLVHLLAVTLLLTACEDGLKISETTKITVYSKSVPERITTDPDQIKKLTVFLATGLDWKRKSPFALGEPEQSLTLWFKGESSMIMRFNQEYIWIDNRKAHLSEKQRQLLEQFIREMRHTD